MPLTPAFTAELAKPALILFGALEIVLPGPTYVRLLDGAGTVTFAGRTFVGRDAVFGVWGGVCQWHRFHQYLFCFVEGLLQLGGPL